MKGKKVNCSCYKCKGKMLPAVDIVFWKGRSYPMDVTKCTKCGEIVSTLEEAERIRKLIHPSLLSRIRSLFNRTHENITEVSFFKGRVL